MDHKSGSEQKKTQVEGVWSGVGSRKKVFPAVGARSRWDTESLRDVGEREYCCTREQDKLGNTAWLCHGVSSVGDVRVSEGQF